MKNITMIESIINTLSMNDYLAKFNTLSDTEKHDYMINGGFSYDLSDMTYEAIAVKDNYISGKITDTEYNDYCKKYYDSLITLTVYENQPLNYDYFDEFIKDDELIKDNLIVFDEGKIVHGSDNPDYTTTKRIFADLSFTCDDDFIEVLTENYDITSDKAAEIIKACDYGYSNNDSETVLAVMNILSGNKYELAPIRGYCQRDYAEIIYNTKIKDTINYIEACYFGKITEVKIIDNSDEYWDHITHDDIWNKSDAELLAYFDLPINGKVVRA